MAHFKKALSLLLVAVLFASCVILMPGNTTAADPLQNIQGPTLVKQDGIWYYVKDGQVCRDTTLVEFNGQQYFVKNGQTTPDLTTLVKVDGSWYYIYKGRVAKEATTLVKYNDQYFYVKNGKVASDLTTLVKVGGSWYYIYNGRVAKETTTLVEYNGQKYYVQNGRVASGLTTLVKVDGCWYYVYKGCLAKSTTSLISFGDQQYFVKNGKVASDLTTLVKIDGSWYYISKGRVAASTTALVKYNGQYFYVKDGKVSTDTTGLVDWAGGRYYVTGGRVASATTGLVEEDGTLYYIKNGKTQPTATTLVEHEGQLHYVEKGKFCKKTLSFDFEGKTYNIRNGIASVKSNGKVIYLTFDDGPGPHTQRLLDILARYNVKVTFFVCNSKYTYLLDDMVAQGHTVAIHSRTHNYSKIYASEAAFYDDLYYMQNVIYEKTGVMSYITRFPGGSSNLVSKKYCPGIMTRLTKSLRAKGFQYVDWNVDSNDAGGTTSTSGVYNNVVNGIRNSSRTHHYVLQHDVHGYSVNAVEQIIQWGLNNGYTFKAITMDSPACHHGVQN